MNKYSAVSTEHSEIVIVGAGPAGTSLAIRLAATGRAVTLIEKDRFPRAKLCGEFISPECFRHFAELGVLEEMSARGGAQITETRFFDAAERSVAVPTRWFGHGDYALSLSRAQMDETMLLRAKDVGVNVQEGSRVTGVEIDGYRIAAIEVKSEREHVNITGDLFIDATGRASTLSRLIEKRSDDKPPARSRLIAFKNHLTGVSIDPAVCEIYVFEGGYGGLSSVEDGKANLCYILDAAIGKEIIGKTNSHVELIRDRNLRASKTLCQAVECGEWLAVPIGEFGRRSRPSAANLASVGDAAAFIDPFTGSGMLMALESAEVLARCIAETGDTAENAIGVYERLHARKFRARLLASSLLRRAAFMPRLATAAIIGAGLSDGIRQRLARATRSGSQLSRDRR